MIDQLRELRDWLDAIEHDPDDPTAIDQAISIVDRLIVACERPLPTPAVGLCYSVKTPVSPAAAAAAPPKAKRPENQQFEINSRKKRKST